MNGQKIVVPLGGKQVEGVEVKVVNAEEQWSTYELEDGTKLQIKIALIRVIRTDEFTPDNDPVYLVNSQNLLKVDAPSSLRKHSATGDQ